MSDGAVVEEVDLEDDESMSLTGLAAKASFGDLDEVVSAISANMENSGLHEVFVGRESGLFIDGVSVDALTEMVATSGSRIFSVHREPFDFPAFYKALPDMQDFGDEVSSGVNTLAGYFSGFSDADMYVSISWFESGFYVTARIWADWVFDAGTTPSDFVLEIRSLRENLMRIELGTHDSIYDVVESRSVDLGEWLESQPEYRAVRVGRDSIGRKLLLTHLTPADRPIKDALLNRAVGVASHLWNGNRSTAFMDMYSGADQIRKSMESDPSYSENITKAEREFILKKVLMTWSGGYPPTKDECAQALMILAHPVSSEED